MRWVMLVLALLLAHPAWAVRDPEKCGRTVVKRALKAYRNGKRAHFPLPKGCPTLIVPPGFYTKPLEGGAVGIFHDQHPDHWLAVVLPRADGIVTMDGATQLWHDGELVGTVTEVQ